MTLIICLIATAANAAGLTSTSRTFWAFARDDAIPMSRYFTHIDTKWRVPVRMVLLVSLLEMLLGLLYLGSYTAFNAVLSMAILGMYLSYVLPIMYMLLYGRGESAVFGPFKLGRAGPAINVVAILWAVLAMIFSTFPNFYPVNAMNMNYSTVVLGGWVLVGAGFWFAYSKRKYDGPLIDVLAVEIRRDSK